MKIYNINQNTLEWEEVRKGKITASTFGQLITPKLKISDPITAKEAICQIIGNAICVRDSDDMETYSMARGSECEPRARELYQQVKLTEVKEVGFVESENGNVGFSPDGLIGDDGMIEIKTQCQKKHIYCKKFGFDQWLKKYKPQILLPMIVNDKLGWCDCISYNEDFAEVEDRIIIHRYYRDEEEIEKATEVLRYWIKYLNELK